MSRILLYGSGEKKSFLFFCMVSLQTCMCLHSEKPADGLKTGRRSVTSTVVGAVWVAEPLPHISGKKVTVIPPPNFRSDSDSHARARRNDKAAEETDFPFAEAAEERTR